MCSRIKNERNCYLYVNTIDSISKKDIKDKVIIKYK